jgi:hypothetical protein
VQDRLADVEGMDINEQWGEESAIILEDLDGGDVVFSLFRFNKFSLVEFMRG